MVPARRGGAGGSVTMSWGEFWSGTSAIQVWEPNRRLRAVDTGRGSKGRVVEIAVDYYIEGQGGKTMLRLRGLRHYLPRHRGTPRGVAWALAKTSLPAKECYRRLRGRRGLVRDGSVEGLREGGGYRIVGATGDVFEGVVHAHDAPSDFAGTVVGLNDGLVRFWAEMGTASIWIATWGVDDSTVTALESRWQEQINKALEGAA